jgi:hypothetical protein
LLFSRLLIDYKDAETETTRRDPQISNVVRFTSSTAHIVPLLGVKHVLNYDYSNVARTSAP